MNKKIRLHSKQSVFEKLKAVNWGLVFLILMISGVGFTALYSAAGGSIYPWAYQQMTRFGVGFVVMIIIALIDVRWWYKLAWPIYIGTLLLLVIVEISGHIGMGAQRWISIGGFNLQPSELMKVAVVLILARYFHLASVEDMRRLFFLFIPVLLVALPVLLVMLQPDLGTGLMISFAGAAMFFMAGAPLYLFITAGVIVACSIPVAWTILHDYQRNRVLTFLNPERDPLGTGYHITQSKIALGSGGIEGKGFLNGSQSHLNFLPEKQTDFIFTLWAEEWGLIGGVFLLSLFGLVFLYGIFISMKVRNKFGRYLSLGLIINFSLYVFINIGMVMGLMPVVGAPLPMISYGGTSMMITLIAFGMVMSCAVHSDSKMTGTG